MFHRHSLCFLYGSYRYAVNTCCNPFIVGIFLARVGNLIKWRKGGWKVDFLISRLFSNVFELNNDRELERGTGTYIFILVKSTAHKVKVGQPPLQANLLKLSLFKNLPKIPCTVPVFVNLLSSLAELIPGLLKRFTNAGSELQGWGKRECSRYDTAHRERSHSIYHKNALKEEREKKCPFKRAFSIVSIILFWQGIISLGTFLTLTPVFVLLSFYNYGSVGNRKCIFCWKVGCTYFPPICSNFCTNCILGSIRTLFQTFFLIPCRSAYEYNWDAAPSQERALLNSLNLRKSFSLRFTSLLDGFEYHFLSCGFYPTFSVSSETNIKVNSWNLPSAFFLVL